MQASNITRRARGNKLVSLLLAVLLCAAAGGCKDRIRGKVISEMPRPGGRVTAILTEDYGKDVYYEVYLRSEKDGSVVRAFSAFDMDAAPSIRWRNPNALVVRMTCADIVGYQNDFGYWWNNGYEFIFIGLEGNNRLCAHAGRSTPGF